jgi:GMP reductase
MKIENGKKLYFNDVYIRPQKSNIESRKDVNLETEYTFLHSDVKWTGIPLIAANMDTTGTFEMAKVLSNNKMLTAMHKFNTLDDWKNKFIDPNYVMVTIGTDNLDYLNDVIQICPELLFIVIDVANGYRESFLNFIKQVRKKYPKKVIIAGNVVTPEMTVEIINAGADIVKVGIGCGSVCNTTKVTGVGYPQLSAVLECSEAARNIGGHIISDGNCKNSGDVAKALCAGANFVMMGGMLAGHDESGGDIVEKDSKMYKEFYGMSSKQAQEKHYTGGMKNYRTSEGGYYLIEYKGPVSNTLCDIFGGLRSTCTYINANNIVQIYEKGSFVVVN